MSLEEKIKVLTTYFQGNYVRRDDVLKLWKPIDAHLQTFPTLLDDESYPDYIKRLVRYKMELDKLRGVTK